MDIEKIEYDQPKLFLKVATLNSNPDKILRGSHCHNAVELISVHSGKIICYIGDNPITVCAGDVLLINKNIVHNVECLDSETIFSFIQIDADRQIHLSKEDYMYNIKKFISKSSSKQYCLCYNKSELAMIFTNIFTEFHSEKAYNTMYLHAYILQLIAFMYRYDFLNQFDSSFTDKLKYIQPVIWFIDNHFAEKLYINDLASIINCNKFHLCKQFKSITTGTVVEYINFVRLQKAADMLLYSSKNITEIAYLCGFSSVQYFNKVFQKSYSCSPKKFKDLHM